MTFILAILFAATVHRNAPTAGRLYYYTVGGPLNIERNAPVGWPNPPVLKPVVISDRWECVTNWSDGHLSSRTLMFPDSANATTHNQIGQVISNRAVVVQIGNHQFSTVAESVVVTNLMRTYQRKVVRYYSDGTVEEETTL